MVRVLIREIAAVRDQLRRLRHELRALQLAHAERAREAAQRDPAADNDAWRKWTRGK